MRENEQVLDHSTYDRTDVDNPAKSRWEEIRRRLEVSRLKLESRFEPSAKERCKILKARAAELARETRDEAGTDTQIDIVEFLLEHEKYGIEPAFIRDIFPLKTLTPVPCTPSFVVGVTNLRGEILSVLDLKKFFDLPDRGLTDFNRVVVLESGTMELGILVDAVVGFRTILKAEIQSILPTLTEIREKYMKGITEDRLAILDGEKILSDEEIVVYEEV